MPVKRLWIGAALLLLLLAAGIFSTVAAAGFHHSLSQRLEATASAAMAQDWEAAEELLHREALWTDLYTLTYPHLAHSACGAEWRASPIML